MGTAVGYGKWRQDWICRMQTNFCKCTSLSTCQILSLSVIWAHCIFIVCAVHHFVVCPVLLVHLTSGLIVTIAALLSLFLNWLSLIFSHTHYPHFFICLFLRSSCIVDSFFLCYFEVFHLFMHLKWRKNLKSWHLPSQKSTCNDVGVHYS